MVSCMFQKKTKEALYQATTRAKNKKYSKAFAAVPPSQRLILVPQCLRNIAVCKAHEEGSYYSCVHCGGCAIGRIDQRAKELGYGGVFILKGGRTVEKLIAELKPKAIIGVACFFEGAQGMELCERFSLPVQFIPLTKDGCVNTEINLDDIMPVIEQVTGNTPGED